jgi:hypothetical protein
MLTDETIDKLKGLIQTSGGADTGVLLGALDDVAHVIGTQALLIRNMGLELDNARVGFVGIARTLEAHSLDDLFVGLGKPKRNTFTVQQAVQANEDLVAKITQARDFSEVLKAVVEVAKVLL